MRQEKGGGYGLQTQALQWPGSRAPKRSHSLQSQGEADVHHKCWVQKCQETPDVESNHSLMLQMRLYATYQGPEAPFLSITSWDPHDPCFSHCT